MAKCPNCGSMRFEYKLRSAGAEVSSSYYRKLSRSSRSWVIPAGTKNVSIKRKSTTIGFCPDCGYIQESKQRMPVGCITAIVVFMAICVIMSLFASPTDSKENGYLWAHEVTPLDQFEYVIDGDRIHLNKYIGHEKRVYVGLEYEVDGVKMLVVEYGSLFSKTVDSVILSDGITEVANSIFNGSSIKNLYLPSTLGKFKGWSYLHDLEYLYYGGSEDDLKSICGGDPSHLVSKRIYYNALVSEIIARDIENHRTPTPTKN